MADGAVLGVHEGQVVEYDADTLLPLGIVVSKKQLKNREVLVVKKGTNIVGRNKSMLLDQSLLQSRERETSESNEPASKSMNGSNMNYGSVQS